MHISQKVKRYIIFNILFLYEDKHIGRFSKICISVPLMAFALEFDLAVLRTVLSCFFLNISSLLVGSDGNDLCFKNRISLCSCFTFLVPLHDFS